MEVFDLGIVWNRQEDSEFIADLNDYALKKGLRPYIMHAYNFYGSLKGFTEGYISFRYFFDRTSDDVPAFKGLADFLKRKKIIFINHADRVKRSHDKSLMHTDFIGHNIPYLSQEKIIPLNLKNRPAWFKVFYCLGEVIPSWWNPVTHMYDILTPAEIDKFKLSDLLPLMKQIAYSVRLDFFTSEIVLNEKHSFYVVDYVNDQPDMRKKSKFDKGVPDEVVEKIVEDIVLFVKQRTMWKPKRWPIEFLMQK